MPCDINYRKSRRLQAPTRKDVRFVSYKKSTTPATQPMRNHHHPDSLFPTGLSFKTTLPNFLLFLYKITVLGFPGGAVVESLPANAGDTGSSPGLGGSHIPRSNWARAPQLLSLRSRAHEPQLLSPCITATKAREPQLLSPRATITEPARLEPVLRNKRGRDSETPAHRDEEWPPLAATRESPRTETKTQHSHK